MNYWLYVFSGGMWDEFRAAGANVAGFSHARRNIVTQIQSGDILLCYLTGAMRWVGVLEVLGPSKNGRRIWAEAEYAARLDVYPMICLDADHGVPMPHLEGLVSFYESAKDAGKYKGFFRSSPRIFPSKREGDLILCLMRDASENPVSRPVDPVKLGRKPVWKLNVNPGDNGKKCVATAPEGEETVEENSSDDTEPEPQPGGRRHTEIQYHLLKLGRDMGFDLWVARNDRCAVWNGCKLGEVAGLMPSLPTQFNSATAKTIELIDVLWLRGNSITAAFEVECTSAVYSGLLRMSDLLSLQPNLDIRLFIVAPDSRRKKVRQELLRPTFRLREKPLTEVCGFIAYDTFRRKIATIQELNLTHSLRPMFLEQEAEYFAGGRG